MTDAPEFETIKEAMRMLVELRAEIAEARAVLGDLHDERKRYNDSLNALPARIDKAVELTVNKLVKEVVEYSDKLHEGFNAEMARIVTAAVNTLSEGMLRQDRINKLIQLAVIMRATGDDIIAEAIDGAYPSKPGQATVKGKLDRHQQLMRQKLDAIPSTFANFNPPTV